MEENLNKMIDVDYEEMFEANIGQDIDDINANQETGILTIENPPMKETIINAETRNEENENTDIVPYGNQFTFLEDDFQPKTEDELITLTGRLHKAATSTIVISYFHIGNAINAYYHKQYGSGELQRIADQTGVSLDTLHKACKFADRYSKEQLEALLIGLFPISWNHIANNLSVEAGELVETYNDSDSPKTFHDAIRKFKKVRPRRAVPIIDANDETPGTDESILEESEADIEDGIIDVESSQESYQNRGEEVKENIELVGEEVRTAFDHEDEMAELNDMLENAKAELLERDKQKQENERIINEMNSAIEVLNDLLEDFKAELMEKDSQIERQNTFIQEMKPGSENFEEIVDQMKLEMEKKDANIENVKQGLRKLENMIKAGAGSPDLLTLIGEIKFEIL